MKKITLPSILRGIIPAAAICILLFTCIGTRCSSVPEAKETAGSSSRPASGTANTSTDIYDSAFGLSPKMDEGQRSAVLAASVSKKYDVDILYKDQIPQTYKDYTAEPVYDSKNIADAIEIIDRTLALYPPGFFRAVKNGYCDSITFCLAGDLHLISDDSYMENADAFTTVQDGRIWLVLNIKKNIEAGLLIHELTHAVDYRLLEMQQLLESEWNRLNPPSFSYYNAYLDETGKGYRTSGSREYTSLYEEDENRIYFYDPYSRTFAMEDRARLMEKLLENFAFSTESASQGQTADSPAPDRCFFSPHVQAKLRFYFYTLRQAFETTLWPEKTSWETALQKVQERRVQIRSRSSLTLRTVPSEILVTSSGEPAIE